MNILPNDMIKVAKIHYDGYYNVSIHMLKDDIMDSVTRQPDGYLENLSDSRDLQSKFVTAINQIYDPIITD